MIRARHVRQLGLLLGVLACSLDDRELRPAAVAGMAGQNNAAGRGGNGPESEGGAAGADESLQAGSGNDGEGGAGRGSTGQAGTGGLVEGCADLDTDGVADCTITLLNTPSFASNVEDWSAVGDAELRWDRKNALGDRPSGSAKLSASGAFARATQCVPLTGEKLLIAYANAFVESDDEDANARALLEVAYFASDDCSGESDGFFETPPTDRMNDWTTVHAGSVASAATRSVLVTLIGVKAGAAAGQSAYFDNVLLSAQDL